MNKQQQQPHSFPFSPLPLCTSPFAMFHLSSNCETYRSKPPVPVSDTKRKKKSGATTPALAANRALFSCKRPPVSHRRISAFTRDELHVQYGGWQCWAFQSNKHSSGGRTLSGCVFHVGCIQENFKRTHSRILWLN